ncbi:hypothetical protein AQUCO_00201157v1 [Aquilegia coerulea]|uniref:Transcription elongation factor Eaf N-terminal domain-containing protein n=1 Tax=Aquilegia coerulea TaxID=218851 RepID=A0A2G5F6I0_AQUCA|nr:hypothetical protein AQUCO_00201157v1 [Aquilegia coerulea]
MTTTLPDRPKERDFLSSSSRPFLFLPPRSSQPQSQVSQLSLALNRTFLSIDSACLQFLFFFCDRYLISYKNSQIIVEMANNNKSKSKEPSTAPQPHIWYNLTLGPSFKDNSTKFCTLRYESKPASVGQTGLLHRSKDNKVTVEFQNNQPGKPKWLFEGSTEEYKDNDAVLFFDGETFRLERLHRSVKRLRRGDRDGQGTEARSPPIGRGSKGQSSIKAVVNSVPVEMERIDIGEPKSPGLKSTGKVVVDNPSAPPFTSPEPEDSKSRELEEHLNMLFEDATSDGTPDKANIAEQEVNTGFDINIPNQNDVDEEIADVDVSDDEAGNRPNAAETLRAQVNAEGSGASSSSSSESSESGSSGSGSGSSSSSDSSDDDSVNSI